MTRHVSPTVPVLLAGVAAGLAITAVVIGLLLLAIAVIADSRADASAVLRHHPLFVAGSELVFSAFLAALPLLALWLGWTRVSARRTPP